MSKLVPANPRIHATTEPEAMGCCAVTSFGEIYEQYTDGLWYPDGEGEPVEDPEGVILWANREVVNDLAGEQA